MACIIDRGEGRRGLQFEFQGNRRELWLGPMTQKQADSVRVKVETIITDRTIGTPHTTEVSQWIAGLSKKLLTKLEKFGLVEGVSRLNISLSEFLEKLSGLIDQSVKTSTSTMYGHTQQNLLTYFTANRPLRSITTEDAEQFREWLKTAPSRKGKTLLAEATVNRRLRLARDTFGKAVKWKYLDANPFSEIAIGTECNRERMHEITEADAHKILAACPDAEWKVLFALSRWGGLRCPSEHLALKWSDVDFAGKRLTVTSSKTAKHVGGGFRVMPLFPEVEAALLELKASQAEGGEWVVTRYRSPRVNLRSQFKRIIKRAGLKPWPRLFHNLRSTRQSELTRTNPEYAVCRWLGNSPTVARKNYLQVSPADFDRALVGIQNPPLQTPLQTSATARIAEQGAEFVQQGWTVNTQKLLNFIRNADFPTSPTPTKWACQDSSPSRETLKIQANLTRAPKDSAPGSAERAKSYSEFTELANLWPHLPEAVRSGLLALARASGKG